MEVTPTETPISIQSDSIPACPQNQFGGSMYFNGNSYVEMQSSSLWTVGRGDFTFEWYMKYTNITPTQSIFYLGGPSDGLGHMSARLFGNILRFSMNNRSVAEGELKNIYNNWTHIAISHHDDKLFIFQDGYLIGKNILNNDANVTGSEHPFRIGGSPTFSSYLYYHGYITNFHYVNGEGLYDGSTYSYGNRVFYKPIPPIIPVDDTKLLLLCDYTCDPAYNSAPNIELSKTNHGMIYTTDYPQVNKLNVYAVDYLSNSFFGLGNETVTPIDAGFSYGDRVSLIASQKKYSLDYYEIHSPITIAKSDLSYITCYGFTASFDPRTDVFMNINADVSGSNSLIVARYR